MQRGMLRRMQTEKRQHDAGPTLISSIDKLSGDKRIVGPTSTWSARESARNLTGREGVNATAMVDGARKALFTLPQREKL